MPLGPETLSSQWEPERGGLEPKKAVNVSRTLFMAAPLERVFDVVDKQLEEKPEWDPTILWVQPITIKHVRVGSMSRVTLRLGGSIEEAVAMVRSYKHNHSIFWTSTHSTQFQEEWRFRNVENGTLVTLTVGYNPVGRLLGKITDMLGMRGRIEHDLTEMLQRLAAEVSRPAPSRAAR